MGEHRGTLKIKKKKLKMGKACSQNGILTVKSRGNRPLGKFQEGVGIGGSTILDTS